MVGGEKGYESSRNYRLMNWEPVELDYESFYETIKSEEFPVFIDFWAAWCPPCRMMDPLFEIIAEKYRGKILIRKLNTDLYRKISDKYNIAGIPTYVIYNKGREVWRKTGALSRKKIEEVFEDILDAEKDKGEI